MRTMLVLFCWLVTSPAYAFDVEIFADEVRDQAFDVCTKTDPKKIVTCHHRFKRLERSLMVFDVIKILRARCSKADTVCAAKVEKKRDGFMLALMLQVQRLRREYPVWTMPKSNSGLVLVPVE